MDALEIAGSRLAYRAEIGSHLLGRHKCIARRNALTRQPKCESVKEVVFEAGPYLGTKKWCLRPSVTLPTALSDGSTVVGGVHGPTPGALRGDDYPLEYNSNEFVELPACLDRRKPKLSAAA